ncbi:hypothetical protein [Halorubrum sp. PV6]|uniref:hypothetical protein n=1 Tax=Halorubrum sp. PV6 TaxID=634157 RepID=UPI001FCE5CFB|nr:hypothetical protein [Halorubrum sp. PV6]
MAGFSVRRTLPEFREVIDLLDVMAIVSKFVDNQILDILIDEKTVPQSVGVTDERRAASATARPWRASTCRIASGFRW